MWLTVYQTDFPRGSLHRQQGVEETEWNSRPDLGHFVFTGSPGTGLAPRPGTGIHCDGRTWPMTFRPLLLRVLVARAATRAMDSEARLRWHA